MRILTIIDKLSVGGRQRTAQDYTLGYQRAGMDVAVLALQAAGPRLRTLQQAGVPVFLGEAGSVGLGEAASWRPDVVHLHSEGPVRPFEARAVEALLAQSARRPIVLETAAFGRVDYRQRYTATDVHLLVSPWVLWRWQQWTRPLVPRPVGAAVPNMVDAQTFYPAPPEAVRAFRAQHGLPPHAVVFGSLARPDPLKWPAFLFDAFEEVAQRHPDAYFLVAGLSDSARGRIAALPEGVRRRIVELPFFHDDALLRTCYSAMDVFLHGSPIGESFGLVFVEALLCGTPIVTHATPAKHNSQVEVVGHERGGLVAAAPSHMAAAMERLLLDPALRHRLAEQGAAHVRAHYTEEHIVPLLLRIVEHARRAPSRDALARALGDDPRVTSDVDNAYIRSLLDHTLGRVPWRQKALMRLVHRPALFRAWWAVKGRLLRQPDADPADPAPTRPPIHA